MHPSPSPPPFLGKGLQQRCLHLKYLQQPQLYHNQTQCEPTVIKKNPDEEEEETIAEFKARLWMFKEPEPGVYTSRCPPSVWTHTTQALVIL